MFGHNFFELNSAPLQRAGESITCAAFDAQQELLWTGSNGGALQSCIGTNLQKYSVFGSHLNPVLSISSSLEGVTSVSSESIKVHSRGGCPISSHSQPNWNISCCESERNDNKILLGHFNSYVSLFDLSTRTTISNCPTFQPVTVLRCNNRFAYVGKSNGQICILDLRTFKIESTIDAHLGGIISLDMKNDLLVSCGCVQKLNQVFTDPLVKVFDIRSGFRSLKKFSFHPGPAFVRFHPKFSSLLLVASQSGKFLFTDIQANNSYEYLQVDCGESVLSACDMSNSGELLAFGDYEGFVHLWGSSEKARINIFSLPTELPDHLPARKKITEKNLSPLPHKLASSAPLFSHTENHQTISVGLPPRKIDPNVLSQIRVMDFVGFVENPNWKRGISYAKSCELSKDLLHSRIKNKDSMTTEIKKDGTEENLETENVIFSSSVGGDYASSQKLPEIYQRIEINESKFAKFEEFDFSFYNKTKFSGLENDTLNSYINAIIHVLYFIPSFHNNIMLHFCVKEFCLSCELKFVFDMMRKAKGKTIQVSNFLRALCHNFTAVSLGVINNPHVSDTSLIQENLSKCIQIFCRFLFNEINKENSNLNDKGKKFMYEIFGIKYEIFNECLGGLHDKIIMQKEALIIDLEYPSPEFETLNFANVLESCLNKSEDVFEYCQFCGKFQSFIQSRKVVNEFPSCLFLNFKIKENKNLVDAPNDKRKVVIENFKSNSNFSSWLPTKFILKKNFNCVRVLDESSISEESKFEMEVERNSDEQEKENQDGHEEVHDIKTIESKDDKDDADHDDRQNNDHYDTYELKAVIFQISASNILSRKKTIFHKNGKDLDTDEDHLVSFIKIHTSFDEVKEKETRNEGDEERKKFEDVYRVDDSENSRERIHENKISEADHNSKGQWFLFNDFFISETSEEEMMKLYDKCKLPCILYYSKLEKNKIHKPTESYVQEKQLETLFKQYQSLFLEIKNNPDSAKDPLRPKPCFVPLDIMKEIPNPRKIFGIDAEFVVLSPENVQKKKNVKIYPRLGLARVSVVRGEGEDAGKPFIDDYISCIEPVYDYITRYSGIRHGDLDESISQHHVTKLKKVYLKLKYLIDSGCIFVGHGLKKDFKIINIFVPANQTIDTVEIFHLKGQRKLSLRFLSSYLLNLDIQSETHDSIEDALTALKLYKLYCELNKEGRFEEKLQEIYQYGRNHGWEVARTT